MPRGTSYASEIMRSIGCALPGTWGGIGAGDNGWTVGAAGGGGVAWVDTDTSARDGAAFMRWITWWLPAGQGLPCTVTLSSASVQRNTIGSSAIADGATHSSNRSQYGFIGAGYNAPVAAPYRQSRSRRASTPRCSRLIASRSLCSALL